MKTTANSPASARETRSMAKIEVWFQEKQADLLMAQLNEYRSKRSVAGNHLTANVTLTAINSLGRSDRAFREYLHHVLGYFSHAAFLKTLRRELPTQGDPHSSGARTP